MYKGIYTPRKQDEDDEDADDHIGYWLVVDHRTGSNPLKYTAYAPYYNKVEAITIAGGLE